MKRSLIAKQYKVKVEDVKGNNATRKEVKEQQVN
jgi:hypothetical protein